MRCAICICFADIERMLKLTFPQNAKMSQGALYVRESTLNVSLEHFEGPLALLLYLIRKEEMDINNIPIHRITQQYLEHMQMMKSLNLEVASDFITMAATLIYIKSKVLLPQYDAEGEDAGEDPRKELVQKLVEYQKFQSATKKLLERPILGRDIWRRGFKEDLLTEGEQDVLVEENGLFELISTWRNIFKAAQKRIHRVMQKGQSIASRILELKDRLIPGRRVVMSDLLKNEDVTKNKLLLTFLSMLELAKIGFIRVFQAEPYSDIHVEPLKNIDGDVITRVESYDGANAEAAAAKILEKAVLAQEQAKRDEQLIQKTEVPPHEAQVEFQFQSAEVAGVTRTGEANDMATDDEILAAEKEMGFDNNSAESVELEYIPAAMEPIEDLQKAIADNKELQELEKLNEEKPQDLEVREEKPSEPFL